MNFTSLNWGYITSLYCHPLNTHQRQDRNKPVLSNITNWPRGSLVTKLALFSDVHTGQSLFSTFCKTSEVWNNDSLTTKRVQKGLEKSQVLMFNCKLGSHFKLQALHNLKVNCVNSHKKYEFEWGLSANCTYRSRHKMARSL